MSRKEYEEKAEKEDLKKVKQELDRINQILDLENSILSLSSNTTFLKFLELYVFNPLKDIQTKSDYEVRTNESFILKGKILTLKSQLKWEKTQKEKCERIRKERESLLRRSSGEKTEHEPE